MNKPKDPEAIYLYDGDSRVYNREGICVRAYSNRTGRMEDVPPPRVPPPGSDIVDKGFGPLTPRWVSTLWRWIWGTT